MLYTFVARDENDVCVERGDFVTVLNQEDPDWTWVVRTDGQEGFVPSGFVYPADVIQGEIRQHLFLYFFSYADFSPQDRFFAAVRKNNASFG